MEGLLTDISKSYPQENIGDQLCTIKYLSTSFGSSPWKYYIVCISCSSKSFYFLNNMTIYLTTKNWIEGTLVYANFLLTNKFKSFLDTYHWRPHVKVQPGWQQTPERIYIEHDNSNKK